MTDRCGFLVCMTHSDAVPPALPRYAAMPFAGSLGCAANFLGKVIVFQYKFGPTLYVTVPALHRHAHN